MGVDSLSEIFPKIFLFYELVKETDFQKKIEFFGGFFANFAISVFLRASSRREQKGREL